MSMVQLIKLMAWIWNLFVPHAQATDLSIADIIHVQQEFRQHDKMATAQLVHDMVDRDQIQTMVRV